MPGPLLFILCINDISNYSDKLKFYLFADDTSLLYANGDLKSLVRTVNAEISKLCEWFTANRLTLIIKKSNHVIFRLHQRILSYKPQIWVFDNNK